MGLRERLTTAIGDSLKGRRMRRESKKQQEHHKKEEQEKILKKIREARQNLDAAESLNKTVDEIVDLEGSAKSLRDFLNDHRPPDYAPWILVHVSEFDDKNGAEGYALVRKIASKKTGIATYEDRYSYIFIGRYFKVKKFKVESDTPIPKDARMRKIKVHGEPVIIIPDKKEEEAGKISVRSGETAKYGGVASIGNMVRLIADDSPVLIDYYSSNFYEERVEMEDGKPIKKIYKYTLGHRKVALESSEKIKQKLGDLIWREEAGKNFRRQLDRIVYGIAKFNEAEGKVSIADYPPDTDRVDKKFLAPSSP